MEDKTFEMEKGLVFLDDMSKIIDRNFLSNTVGWNNHGDPLTVFHNGKANKWVCFDDDTNEIKEFVFDEVHCCGMHGFCGTRYDYIFYLEKNNVDIGYKSAAPTVEALKKIKIEELTFEIERIDNLIETRGSLLNRINLIKAIGSCEQPRPSCYKCGGVIKRTHIYPCPVDKKVYCEKCIDPRGEIFNEKFFQKKTD